MSRPQFSVPLMFSRAYATRRPTRPPLKVRDPLLNDPNAQVQSLPEDMTFIHRPPPSAPTPHSTTVAPASPLLRAPTPIAPARPLPPILRSVKGFPEERILGEEDFEEMRRLRATDPEHWSRGRLAKHFKCSAFLVGQQAKLDSQSHREKAESLQKEHEANRSQWGEKKALFKAIRNKRRSLW